MVPADIGFPFVWTSEQKKEKWQHYKILTSGNCETYSFYTNLTHILILVMFTSYPCVTEKDALYEKHFGNTETPSWSTR